MCLDTSTSKSLTWEQRLQIALDAAQGMNAPSSGITFIPVHCYNKVRIYFIAGLEYLHVGCKPALIHRDVKSRNILLTTDLGAKIADFCLTKVFSDSKTHITTEPAGTMGYLDPEYIVYSYIILSTSSFNKKKTFFISISSSSIALWE